MKSMKVNFDIGKPCPGYYQLKNGTVVPFKPEYPGDKPPADSIEVCTADGREWHQIDWYWARMNPAVKDTVNTTEVISDQDQMNMCIGRAADLGVPLFKED